jgi:hypothetical protein
VALTLEERVRRLEVALAVLQDTRRPEPHLADKVTGHITREPASTVAAELPPGPRLATPRPPGKGAGWLFKEMLAEARVIPRMYFDPRYRMTWLGRFGPLVLVLAFFFAHYVVLLIPLLNLLLSVPILGAAVVMVAQLVIAFALFKLLAHEARRYRETSPDLPPSLRL